MPGGLAVVFWQAAVEGETDGEHQQRDADADWEHHARAGDGGLEGFGGGVGGGFGEGGAPVPEGDDVDLLGALDDAGTVDPGCYRCAT